MNHIIQASLCSVFSCEVDLYRWGRDKGLIPRIARVLAEIAVEVSIPRGSNCDVPVKILQPTAAVASTRRFRERGRDLEIALGPPVPTGLKVNAIPTGPVES
jgi:hypothetical protein